VANIHEKKREPQEERLYSRFKEWSTRAPRGLG